MTSPSNRKNTKMSFQEFFETQSSFEAGFANVESL